MARDAPKAPVGRVKLALLFTLFGVATVAPVVIVARPQDFPRWMTHPPAWRWPIAVLIFGFGWWLRIRNWRDLFGSKGRTEDKTQR